MRIILSAVTFLIMAAYIIAKEGQAQGGIDKTARWRRQLVEQEVGRLLLGGFAKADLNGDGRQGIFE